MMLRCLLFALLLWEAAPAQEKKPAAEYEMTRYVFGLLKKGPNWGTGSKEESAKIQEGHMANIRRMAESGKLIVAGPLMDNGDIRGISSSRQMLPKMCARWQIKIQQSRVEGWF